MYKEKSTINVYSTSIIEKIWKLLIYPISEWIITLMLPDDGILYNDKKT
jgi:hypothetical protein